MYLIRHFHLPNLIAAKNSQIAKTLLQVVNCPSKGMETSSDYFKSNIKAMADIPQIIIGLTFIWSLPDFFDVVNAVPIPDYVASTDILERDLEPNLDFPLEPWSRQDADNDLELGSGSGLDMDASSKDWGVRLVHWHHVRVIVISGVIFVLSLASQVMFSLSRKFFFF